MQLLKKRKEKKEQQQQQLTEDTQVPKQKKGIDTSTAHYLNRTLFQWWVQPQIF